MLYKRSQVFSWILGALENVDWCEGSFALLDTELKIVRDKKYMMWYEALIAKALQSTWDCLNGEITKMKML